MPIDDSTYGRAVRLLLFMDIPLRDERIARLIEDGIDRGLPDQLIVQILTERTEPTPQHPSSTGARIHRLMKSRDLLDWNAEGHAVPRQPAEPPPTPDGTLEVRRRIEALTHFAKEGEARQLREAAGWSLDALASKILIQSGKTLAEWESGKKCPGSAAAVRWWAEVKPRLR